MPLNGREGESSGYFCRFTFGQFFALLVLEVFTIFFVFYLGAKYGRELLGLSKSDEALSEVSRMESSETSAKVPTTADPEVKEMVKDLAEKSGAPDLKQRISEMLAQSSAEKPKEAEPPQEKTEALPAFPDSEDAPTVSQELNQPEKTEKPDAGTVVKVKSSSAGKYSLQVGSYSDMEEAKSHMEKWKGKGYQTFITIADIPDRGRWYRVRIGGFSTRDEAKDYQMEFEADENVETIVVLNEN